MISYVRGRTPEGTLDILCGVDQVHLQLGRERAPRLLRLGKFLRVLEREL